MRRGRPPRDEEGRVPETPADVRRGGRRAASADELTSGRADRTGVGVRLHGAILVLRPDQRWIGPAPPPRCTIARCVCSRWDTEPSQRRSSPT